MPKRSRSVSITAQLGSRDLSNPTRRKTIKTVRQSQSKKTTRSLSLKSKTKTKTIEESAIVAFLVKVLSQTFPELSIRTSEEENKTHVRGYLCESEDKCECFNLIVDNKNDNPHILVDRIKYKYGVSCTLSGTDVMSRLERVFNDVVKQGFAHKIQMYDRARVNLTDIHGHEHEIYLAFLYIMLYGKPWYSKFGFKSIYEKKETEHNEILMNKGITPQLFKKINSQLSPEHKLKIRDTFKTTAKLLDPRNKPEYTLAFLELYKYLLLGSKQLIKYAHYDVWFVPQSAYKV